MRMRSGLFEGPDKNKDQSYFLAMMKPDQLERARFPLGDLTKPQVRELARKAGLPVAEKKDSQGICFIGNIRMQDFLRHHVPDQPGPIIRVDDGREIGRHRWPPPLHHRPAPRNRGSVQHRPSQLRRGGQGPGTTRPARRLRRSGRARDSSSPKPGCKPELAGRPDSGSTSPPGSKGPLPRSGVELEYIRPKVTEPALFSTQPQRALAAGQILAFYEGERLLGGAVFDKNNT